MPPSGRAKKTPDPREEYRAGTAAEAATLAKAARKAGLPQPLGDPTSGILLVMEPNAGPRAVDALARSLDAVGLFETCVTFCTGDLLRRQILALQPQALVAVGPEAAREIDSSRYPLVRTSFADAAPGSWFAWTTGTRGLVLPPLSPALDDEAAKRSFWRAFLVLRSLTRR